MTAILIIVGRVLLGGYFLQAGLRNARKFALHTGILGRLGVPMPQAALVFGLALQILGGLSVGVGLYPAWGAAALIVFTVLANALYHNFLRYQGDERASHLNSVLTNLGMIGGLLLVAATA